jgi:hypothetical protein
MPPSTSYREARDRGGEFLLRQLRSPEELARITGSVSEYYKIPMALLVCGHTGEAARLLHWVRGGAITAEGDFGPRGGGAIGYYHVYFNVWILMGAARLGQFDLVRQGIPYLLRFHDEESGGFYSTGENGTAGTPQDLWVTCGAGQAALYGGRLEVARGVGLWLERLMRLQPDYPARLFPVYSRARGLHTTGDPAEEIRFVYDPLREQDAYFFNPGIAGGFLVNLYKATGESRWLELAKQYMRQAELASDFQYHTLRAGKVAWAASLLYTFTREEKYRNIAARAGDNLIQAQDADGGWKPSFMSWNDATAEMVVWLDEIDQAL